MSHSATIHRVTTRKAPPSRGVNISPAKKLVLGRGQGRGGYLYDEGKWWDFTVAWRDYTVAKGLTERELSFLKSEYFDSTSRSRIQRSATAKDRAWFDKNWPQSFPFRAWCAQVLAISIDLRPSGRAFLRELDTGPRLGLLSGPSKPAPYRVEIQFQLDDDRKARPTSVHIIGERFLYKDDAPDLETYYAAFYLRIMRGRPPDAFTRIPRKRPNPGTAPDPDFYRRLLDSYEKLVSEGHAAPAAALAERMNENRSTVKSWLRRGRVYLGRV